MRLIGVFESVYELSGAHVGRLLITKYVFKLLFTSYDQSLAKQNC